LGAAYQVADFAHKLNKEIYICEKLQERKIGKKSGEFLQMRWDDFNFCEEGGETLGNVQQRNIQVLSEIVNRHPNECIVIGTHGTALSTILNYYNSSFNINYFKQIWHSMPYVIQVDFEGESMVRTKELLRIDRGY